MCEDIQICERCIMDSTVPSIWFDENGICNYCKIHDDLDRQYPLNEVGEKKLEKLLNVIKKRGKSKKYDCVIGISGGTDSTYTLYLAKELGLRPLAVHLDNKWNSDIAEENMKNAVRNLEVDFKRIEVDWNEFKALQIAFLKASTPEAEAPSDVGITSTLYKIAAQEGIHYSLTGQCFRTEGKIPPLWSYCDGKYVESIYKQFTMQKLKFFPNLTFGNLLFYGYIKRINRLPLLYYVDYRKQEVKQVLEKELDWKDYGGHHYESIYTRFCYSYLLPKKFNIDKRKTHFSAKIRSGQMKRNEALEKIRNPPISEEQAQSDMKYIIEKLNLTEKEFKKILSAEPKSFLDYPNYYNIIKYFRTPIKFVYKFMSSAPPLTLMVMDSSKK